MDKITEDNYYNIVIGQVYDIEFYADGYLYFGKAKAIRWNDDDSAVFEVVGELKRVKREWRNK